MNRTQKFRAAGAIMLSVATILSVPVAAAQAVSVARVSSPSYKNFQLRSQVNIYYGFSTPSKNVRCEFQPADNGAPGSPKNVLDVRCEAKKVDWASKVGMCGKFKYQNVMSQTYYTKASRLSCTMARTLLPPDFSRGWADGYPTLKHGMKVNFMGYVCSVHGTGLNERAVCAYPGASKRGFTYGRSVVKVAMPYSEAQYYEE